MGNLFKIYLTATFEHPLSTIRMLDVVNCISNYKINYENYLLLQVEIKSLSIRYTVDVNSNFKEFIQCSKNFPPSFFSVALRPKAGHGLLILEVSRSNTTTYHSR